MKSTSQLANVLFVGILFLFACTTLAAPVNSPPSLSDAKAIKAMGDPNYILQKLGRINLAELADGPLAGKGLQKRQGTSGVNNPYHGNPRGDGLFANVWNGISSGADTMYGWIYGKRDLENTLHKRQGTSGVNNPYHNYRPDLMTTLSNGYNWLSNNVFDYVF
ncbi:hypothetical protein TWF281_000676 [Arthrobotrys megalospora]